MAWAAKDLGQATPSCNVCSVGEWPCDEWYKYTDKSMNGDPGERHLYPCNQIDALTKVAARLPRLRDDRRS
jgi:hypothetical protein